LEIRQIKYFLAVVDSGSVSRAAGRLFVAQSALSKQISDLETDLDVQLLHRSRSGVFPTESGKVFYEYGKAILKQMSDAREAVHFPPMPSSAMSSSACRKVPRARWRCR